MNKYEASAIGGCMVLGVGAIYGAYSTGMSERHKTIAAIKDTFNAAGCAVVLNEESVPYRNWDGFYLCKKDGEVYQAVLENDAGKKSVTIVRKAAAAPQAQ